MAASNKRAVTEIFPSAFCHFMGSGVSDAAGYTVFADKTQRVVLGRGQEPSQAWTAAARFIGVERPGATAARKRSRK